MYVLGCDVHAGYYARSPIDFAKVRDAGLEFVIAKHTEGNDPRHDDGTFWRTVEKAQEHGLIVGRYHFGYGLPDHPAHPGRSPIEEAERSWRASRGFGSRAGELLFVDAENPSVNKWPGAGCSPSQMSAWWRDHCDAVAQRWGRKPIIYTYPAWWKFLSEHADTSWASEYGLWLASGGALHQWAPAEGQQPQFLSWVKRTWSTWLFWQYGFDGSSVRVPGIDAVPVDRDCFNGDRAALLRLAGLDPDSPTARVLPDFSEPKDDEDITVIHPRVNPEELAHAIIDARNRGDE